MKRWLLGLLVLLCMVSMVACSKSAPSLEGEWQAQDALKKDYTIVFKKDKVKIGEQDYNYTVDGPKSKDDFTYYSLKVKDQGKETSYTLFSQLNPKRLLFFYNQMMRKNPLRVKCSLHLIKKTNQTIIAMSKSI